MKEEYIMVYSEFWTTILEAKLTGADMQLLFHIVDSYASGTLFCITNAMREHVSNKTGKSPESYRNCTRKLLDNKFIYKIDGVSRTYRLNPRLVYKGFKVNREIAIKIMESVCPDC